MSTVLEVRSVTKYYPMGRELVRALDGVSLQIAEGEFVAIMGASGSGKSTLLNILGCLDLPTAGQYLLCGDDVSKLTQSQLARIRSRRIGFVFQSFELLPRQPALKQVQLPLVYAGVKDKRRRALEALARVGLSSRSHHRPSELSGGQRQRVAIARALAQQPAILLADEPTGNLDSKTGDEILELFRELNGDGQTIIVVTHDPKVAAQCRRVVTLSDGKVLSDDNSDPAAAIDQKT